MNRVTEVAKKKMEELGEEINPHNSIIPQLIQAVFKPLVVPEDDQEWEPDSYDLNEEVQVMMFTTDKEAEEYMAQDEAEADRLAQLLERETTEIGIRGLLVNQLWDRKSELEERPARYYHP